MYWSALAGVIHWPKIWRKKIQVDLHHHWHDHEPYEHGNGKVDLTALPELHRSER